MIAERAASNAISIHALREEGDSQAFSSARLLLGYFYPRPPRGGRPYYYTKNWWRCQLISIHALREEGDVGQYTAARWA